MSKLNTEHFFAGLSHPGKKRAHNEDQFLVDQALGLAIVCDGMGGHAAGEVASALAIEVTHKAIKAHANLLLAYEQNPNPELRSRIKKLINSAVQQACKKVWDEAQADKEKKGMGTTIALALICGDSGFVAHVGDSRVYLHREGSTRQLTEDHTLVNEYLKQGILDKDKAVGHPQGNIIMRSVGIQEAVQVDILHLEMMSEDKLLLCSDGLTDYLKEGQLKDFYENNSNEKMAQTLVDYANDCGGKDNVTVVTLEYRKKDQIAGEQSKIVSKKISTLQSIPLFKEFNYKELIKLLDVIEVRTYLEGQSIIIEGEKGDEMFVTLRGEAIVQLKGVQINKIQPGAYFGEMGLIDDEVRMATVRASQKCKFLVFKKESFFRLLNKEPAMAAKVYWAFLQTLNNRLRVKEHELLAFKKAA